MMHRWRLLVGALGLLSTTGCFDNITTEFPVGLEPIDPVNLAMPPEGTESDPFPEALGEMYEGEEDGYLLVHARGYVNAPIAKVWSCQRVREVSVDRSAVSRWSFTDNVETGYDDSYRIHNEVDNIITVEFDITWRHGVVRGSVENPEEVAISYQKTYGTEFIDLLAGSIFVNQVDDTTTAISLMEHLAADGGEGHKDVRDFFDVYFDSVVACVNDEPLP